MFMNIVYILLAIFILIISLSIKVYAFFRYDLLNNVGTIKIKVFGIITIFKSKITLIGEYLNLTPEKENVIPIKIELNNVNIKYFQSLYKRLQKKLYSTKLQCYVEMCLENAQIAALMSTVLNNIITLYFIKVAQSNKDIELYKQINTGFRHNVIETEFHYKFIITLYDFIWTAINTYIIVRRETKNEKRQQRHEQQQANIR